MHIRILARSLSLSLSHSLSRARTHARTHAQNTRTRAPVVIKATATICFCARVLSLSHEIQLHALPFAFFVLTKLLYLLPCFQPCLLLLVPAASAEVDR